MCRLFATISSEFRNAEHPLRFAPQSLLIQSAIDKKRLQKDGWGVGWFKGGRPKVLNSSLAINRDLPRLARAGRIVESRVLLGHIRWASNPLKLSKNLLIGLEHTQPFLHEGYLFAHNGTLYIPREVTAALGSWAKFLKGRNDSEVLFYWLLKHFHESKGKLIESVVRQSIQGLHEIWQGVKKRYALYRWPYHGLNWVLTNGKTLYAFCYVDPGGFGKSKALCNRSQPYYQMQVQQTQDAVTVASEPLDPQPPWVPMRHGELLTAERKGPQIRTHRERVC